jgi:hypothetical protein
MNQKKITKAILNNVTLTDVLKYEEFEGYITLKVAGNKIDKIEYHFIESPPVKNTPLETILERQKTAGRLVLHLDAITHQVCKIESLYFDKIK